MPYHVGKKSSYGCKGFPALKDDGTVMGCHATAKEAAGQIYAINRSEGNIDKALVAIGDFVIASCEDEIYIGRVEHVMSEGSVGIQGSEYYMEATAENPAVVIRTLEFESEDQYWEETEYLINVLASEVVKISPLDLETEDMEKADGSYSPPAGARSAARRAIKFKEDGKATGAGTSVGWTRAGQLARGESLSLSTVKRMYSYFSRHEVDKKGKDWANQSNPSNGYIMWLAWGGDAGFSWARGIVQREMDKALFADFGKDYTKSSKIVDIK